MNFQPVAVDQLSIVPGSCRKRDAVAANTFADPNSRQTRPAHVPKAHDITGHNVQALCRFGIHGADFAIFDLGAAGFVPHVRLAMEPRRRLARDEVKLAVLKRIAFGRRQPARVSGAIGKVHCGNRAISKRDLP